MEQAAGMILEATAQASSHRQGPGGLVHRSSPPRGLERALRAGPPQPPCNRVSRAVAEARSRVQGAAGMPG